MWSRYLASAYVLFSLLSENKDTLTFSTKSGELSVTRKGDLLALNFPSRPPLDVQPCVQLREALSGNPSAILAARDYLVVYNSEDEVRALQPDMEKLKTIDKFAVIVTAPGSGYDFVSRFFAPAKGIPEDPVTGSAHCTLIPYWAGRLGKTELHAKQISPRGGELFCKLSGDRVEIAGRATLYLKGEITVSI